MRFRHIATTAAVAAVLTAGAAGAAPNVWEEAGTPQGGPVFALAHGPDGTLYAGTMAGVFTSRDGVAWQRAGTFPESSDDPRVDALVAPNETTAYAVAAGWLFKSLDAGTSWRRIGHGIDTASGVTSVAVAADRPDVVYAGTAPSWTTGHVYRSADGGKTWAATEYGVEEGFPPYVIAVDPTSSKTAYVGTYNSAEDDLNEPSGGVYKTENSGATWTPLSIGLPLDLRVVSLVIDPSRPQTIYAGTESHGVFKTTNGGFKWRGVRSGLPKESEGYATVNALEVDPADPNVIYAATSRGAVTSLDGGATWTQTNGGSAAGDLGALVAMGRDTVLAGSLEGGVLVSTDRGASWGSRDSGLTAVAVMAIAPNARSALVGTFSNGLVTTPDGGQTWTPPALPGRTIRAIAVNPQSRRTIYVGADDAGVMKSVDGGQTWKAANRGLDWPDRVDALVMDPRRPSTLYAVSSWDVFKTVNAGTSWRRAGRPYELSALTVAIDPKRPSILYAGGDDAPIMYVSKDAGKHWKPMTAGLPRWSYDSGVEARALVVSPTTGTAFAAFDRNMALPGREYVGEGVYRLQRGGKRWTRVTAGLPRLQGGQIAALRSLAVHPRTGAVLVGTNMGVFRLVRSRGAWEWQLADPSLAGQTVRRIAFSSDGSRLYAATPGRLLVSR